MLTVILLVAGYIDFKYKKIPSFIILLLFIYGTLLSPVSVLEKVFGFILTAVPLLVLALLTDKIKGGDLKFIAVLAFGMGITRLAWLLFYTTGFALIYSVVRKEKSVPLAFCTLLGWLSVSVVI